MLKKEEKIEKALNAKKLKKVKEPFISLGEQVEMWKTHKCRIQDLQIKRDLPEFMPHEWICKICGRNFVASETEDLEP
jgi:hypothetical protein